MSTEELHIIRMWDARATATLQRGIAVVQRCIEVDKLSSRNRPTFDNATRGTSNKDKTVTLQEIMEKSQHRMDLTKKRGGVTCTLCLCGPAGNTKTKLHEFILS